MSFDKKIEKMNVQDILKKKDVTIVDVREPYEFMTDRIYDAVNMPLSNFGSFLEDLKKMKGDIVFYCRSGNRSGQAVDYLKSLGMENVYNGGSLVFMRSFLVS